MSATSAVDVITQGLGDDLEGYVPVSAILVVAAIDPVTGEEHLIHRRDNDASQWKHVGMLTVALDCIRRVGSDEDGQ